MKNLAKFLIVLVLSVPLLSTAQEAKKVSLAEAQDYAMQNSPAVKNALLDIEIARKKVWETTAIGLPQASAKLSYNNMLDIPVSLVPAMIFDPDAPPGTFMELQFGTQHNSTFEFSASQLLFSGPYIVGLQASRIYLRLSQENLEKTELDLKQSVKETYYMILFSQETKTTIDSSLYNMESLLEETEALYKQGFVEETDVDQLRINVNELKNTVKSFDRQIMIAFNLLKFQMGMNLSDSIVLTDDLDSFMAAINLDILFSKNPDLSNNIDYRMMTTQEGLTELSLKREKSNVLPSLAAFYSYQENAMRDEFNFFDGDEKWFPTNIVGFSLEIPLFNSGMRWSKIQQAEMELEKVRNSKAQLNDALLLEYQQAKMEFLNAVEKYQNEQENLLLGQKIMDRTTVKFKSGLASSFEITQANSQLLQTQSRLIAASLEMLNAKVKLDKILNNI